MEAEKPIAKKDDHSETEEYGDQGIASNDAPIPAWLKVNYVFWVIFGLVGLFLYWNGSHGWLDRGYWNELQRAANTVYPFNTQELVERAAEKKG